MHLPSEHRRKLDQQGYVVLVDFMSPQLLRELQQRVEELFQREGSSAGAEFKQESGCRRLANLVNKGNIFQQVIGNPQVLEYVRYVLGPQIKLSSLNARSVNPNCQLRQPLHCDMGAVADQHGYWVCNTVWMLDEITPDNGAIRVVPGSHRTKQLPQNALDDPLDEHPDQQLITGRSGTVVVMNAHLWHGGTENHRAKTRTALHAFYCRKVSCPSLARFEVAHFSPRC